MNCFSEEQLSRISHLVIEIEKLTDVEKLFLYLQLPCGRADASDVNNKSQRFSGATTGGIQKSLDLFSKKPDQETTQTYTWILSHLEIDPNVSLPKQEVYDEYRVFCQANRFEPLCVADFGKAMKHAFPCIKPRRLGQRGNSRYCYSGLRKRYKIQPPNLPDICAMSEQVMPYCTMTNCDQSNSNNTPSLASGVSITSANSKNNNDSSSSSFNGNNMTTKNSTSSRNAECQLLNNKRPNYDRPEVMNLKIEPNIQHQHTNHNPSGVTQFTHEDPSHSKQHQVNYSFQLDSSGQQHTTNSGPHQHQPAMNNNSPHQSHHQHHQHHQHHEQQQHSATTSSASSYDNHAHGHHLSQHTSRYTDYSSRTIQQPGTPDDDDYRHNYQDMQPLSGHFLGSTAPTTPATLPPAHNSQNPPQIIPSTSVGSSSCSGNFGYHQQPFGQMATTCVAAIPPTTTSITDGHGSMVRPNDRKYISSVLQNQPPFDSNGSVQLTVSSSGSQLQPSHHRPTVQPSLATITAAATSNNIHLINHQMSVTHMDACASPFQSPASTPYPTMSSNNYPMQDMMQEYCSSGCRLYQST